MGIFSALSVGAAAAPQRLQERAQRRRQRASPPWPSSSSPATPIDWWVVLLIAVGSFLGGLVGARVGRRIPPAALRGLIVLIGVVGDRQAGVLPLMPVRVTAEDVRAARGAGGTARARGMPAPTWRCWRTTWGSPMSRCAVAPSRSAGSTSPSPRRSSAGRSPPGHRPRSLLMAERWLDRPRRRRRRRRARTACRCSSASTTVHGGAHRVPPAPRRAGLDAAPGAADGGRPSSPAPGGSLVLEDIVDHTNVGAAFRSGGGARDRRHPGHPAVRGPASTAARSASRWAPSSRCRGRGSSRGRAGSPRCSDAGFTVAALALADDAVTLDELAADPPERLALVLGTEGDGLGAPTAEAART